MLLLVIMFGLGWQSLTLRPLTRNLGPIAATSGLSGFGPFLISTVVSFLLKFVEFG